MEFKGINEKRASILKQQYPFLEKIIEDLYKKMELSRAVIKNIYGEEEFAKKYPEELENIRQRKFRIGISRAERIPTRKKVYHFGTREPGEGEYTWFYAIQNNKVYSLGIYSADEQPRGGWLAPKKWPSPLLLDEIDRLGIKPSHLVKGNYAFEEEMITRLGLTIYEGGRPGNNLGVKEDYYDETKKRLNKGNKNAKI